MSFISNIRSIYKRSLKKNDIAWNIYVARPLASFLVFILKRTRITPNQITILGALIFSLMLVPLLAGKNLGLSSTLSILLTVLIIELAYIFDCADGQIARLKGLTSPIGAYFDFLIDEIKAMLLIGGFTIRLWQESGSIFWLFLSIFGVIVVSAATSLTNFIRRKEYTGGDEIQPGASANISDVPQSILGKIAWLVKRTLSFIVHYPSWIWILPLLEFITYKLSNIKHTLPFLTISNINIPLTSSLTFVILYLGVYILYLVKTSLEIILKLGRQSFYKL